MTNATQPPLSTLSIPRAVGSVTINVEAGKPIFIVGRNGTGKSALVHSMINKLGQKVVYLPGSRPSHFDQESLTMSPAARANLINNLKSWDASPDVRWRVSYGS
jgi:ABC-type cobalamin/Fe3+-siderophores transport system ATPase subunit